MVLVCTNDNCIGCNKCISVCSCNGANISVINETVKRIDVDETKCIACGACMDVCKHHAREFEDDTERFFADLERGKRYLSFWRRRLRLIIQIAMKLC